MDEGVNVNGWVDVDEGVGMDGGVNMDEGAGAYKNMVDGGGMYVTDPKSQPRPLQYCFPCRQIGGFRCRGGFVGQGTVIALGGATNECENGGPPVLNKGVGWDVMGTGGLAVSVSFRSGVFLVVVVISKPIGGHLRLVLAFGGTGLDRTRLTGGPQASANRRWWGRFELVVERWGCEKKRTCR